MKMPNPLAEKFNRQIEVESTVSDIVEQLKMIGNDGGALLLLDRELGQRQAV